MTCPAWLKVDWRIPSCGIAVALAVFIPLLLTPMFELAELFFTFVGLPVAMVILLLGVALRKSMSVLVMTIAVVLTAFLVSKHSMQIRLAGRWLLWGHEYKAALSHPKSATSGMPHMEWDGWGFAGNETVVYVVFDSSDSLASAAKNHLYGKVPGVPCGVSSVERLEKHWYSVVMYTDTSWDEC